MADAPATGLALPPFVVGDPVPWFSLPSTTNDDFRFHTTAGRYVVLCFFRSAGDPAGRAGLEDVLAQRALFDDAAITFFGVSTDRRDRDAGQIPPAGAVLRYFWDFDGQVTRAFTPPDGVGVTYILDPNLRVLAALRFDDPRGHAARVAVQLRGLPPADRHSCVEPHAPVLVVPRLFEPGLCRTLIDLYMADGGQDSGFMREIDGKTVSVVDHQFKRRRDFSIEDPALRDALMRRVHRRLVPEIKKAFQFLATRMERYIVACYDAETGGHFRPHRDNTTSGTAHRRFAVTINLNAEQYEGGDLRFPEYGSRTYRAPTGGAVVFSCSLLHEATPVTRGRRFAFLPFLYDDAAAAERAANNVHLGEGVTPYELQNKGS